MTLLGIFPFAFQLMNVVTGGEQETLMGAKKEPFLPLRGAGLFIWPHVGWLHMSVNSVVAGIQLRQEAITTVALRDNGIGSHY